VRCQQGRPALQDPQAGRAPGRVGVPRPAVESRSRARDTGFDAVLMQHLCQGLVDLQLENTPAITSTGSSRPHRGPLRRRRFRHDDHARPRAGGALSDPYWSLPGPVVNVARNRRSSRSPTCAGNRGHPVGNTSDIVAGSCLRGCHWRHPLFTPNHGILTALDDLSAGASGRLSSCSPWRPGS